MSRLGIILDVSHLSENGFWHVDSITPAPLIASHSSCRALQDHPRNLTDRQIRAIGEHGGFVAINAFAPFLADSATSADLIAHVQHAMSILGADRVGLGPDFMADLMPIVDPILGGALIDIKAIPMLDDVQRPGDLAGLGSMLIDALGAEDAAWVSSGTLRRRLEELLPAVTS
jgi:membrane dipeptidase